MNADRIGWVTLWFLAALGLTLGLAGIARGSAPSLRDNIIAVAPGLSSRSEENVSPAELADAVVSVTASRQWAALLLAIGSHESAFRSRIARSECRKGECDGGRAWGVWQIHRSSANADVWGSPSLAIQAREASRIARAGFYLCRRSEVPFPLSTFRAYAGRGCLRKVYTEESVVSNFNRILGRL